MKRYSPWLAVAGCCLLLFTITGCCKKENIKILAVTVHPQETSMWCWAASGQMCMDYLGTSPNQCTQANNRFGRTDCCNNPVPSDCVVGGWPEFTKYGFTSIHTSDAALPWETIREEVCCNNRPFCFTWHWSGGGGHMTVVSGYKTIESGNHVLVTNPGNGGDVYWITYDYYVNGGGSRAHWDDYYQIKKN